MWGPVSKSDERYYKRKDAESSARDRRQEAREADYSKKREILDRVKRGEISLTEGQKLISLI